MAPTAATRCCLLLLVLSPCAVDANAFLRASHHRGDERLSADAIETSLLEEVENVLGAGTAASRVDGLKATLQPMFAALPKNEHGNLGHATVRYALHRLFIQRHGWSVKGLDRAGGSWNASSPAGVLKDQVSGYVQDLFEARLGGRGMGLQELVIMAATIEHLIHNEATGRLSQAYKVHQLLPSGPVNKSQAYRLLDTYMMTYILGENLTSLSEQDVLKLDDQIDSLYMEWNSTQKMVRGELQKVLDAASRRQADELDFTVMAKTVDKVGEDFGSFQDGECKQLKATLLDMGDRRTGRVRLADFYKPALQQGHWQFQESPSYLRQLGALDESNPNDPSVVVTNYLYSQTNCIAASSYYAVCCMDECEGLMSSLERAVAAPQAEPAHIAALVSSLPSSTVTTPRTLSTTLVGRLSEIAAGHGGTVPLHGRLFAQWMHLAFPRECAYPHSSNTTAQQLPEAWQQNTGAEAAATHEEMTAFTAVEKPQAPEASAEDADSWDELAPWTPDEELLVVRPVLASRSRSVPASLRSVALLALAFCLAVAVIRALLQPSSAHDAACVQKIMV